MSRPGEPTGRTQRPHLGAGAEPPSDRFHAALALDANKPDSKDFALDLGSPVSPLQPRASSAAVTNTSSSSSSSGSVTGKPRTSAAAARSLASAGAPGRRNHSGELSGESSPTALDGRNLRPGHRRTGSSPFIYSGGGGSSSVSSPVTNVLPAGNICPSGIIGKTGMIPQRTPRSDVLGSGTGNYGHGSIMRGGAAGAGAAKVSGDAGMGNFGDSVARKAMASLDLQEVTMAANEQYKKGQFAEALRLYDRGIAMCQHNAAYRSSLASCRSNRAAALIGLGRLVEAVKECEEVVRLDPVNDRAHLRLSSLYLR